MPLPDVSTMTAEARMPALEQRCLHVFSFQWGEFVFSPEIAVADGEMVNVLPSLTYGKSNVLQTHCDAIPLEDFVQGLAPCGEGRGEGRLRQKRAFDDEGG